MSEARLDIARRFFEAYNAGRAAEFLQLLDPEVELETLRGVERGHEGARAWLARARGKVFPHVICDRIFDRDGRVLVLARLQLRSRASNEILQEADVASVFDFSDDEELVRRWRMYADPAEALRALGIPA